MKVSPHFDVREFVPKDMWDRFGEKSIWFVNPKLVEIAEFYKTFFLKHFQKTNGNKLVNVLVVVNNWHYGGSRQYSGIRPAYSNIGAANSQHKYKAAFDCQFILRFKDGESITPDYRDIHKIIMDHEEEFLEAGVTTLEHPDYAKTWLHTDIRWIPDQTKLLIVKP